MIYSPLSSQRVTRFPYRCLQVRGRRVSDDYNRRELPVRIISHHHWTRIWYLYRPGEHFVLDSQFYLHAFRSHGYHCEACPSIFANLIWFDSYVAGTYGKNILEPVMGDRLTPKEGIALSDLKPVRDIKQIISNELISHLHLSSHPGISGRRKVANCVLRSTPTVANI